jgi:hypothetical protein
VIGEARWTRSGGLWFSSSWCGTATVEETLDGGNVVVRKAPIRLLERRGLLYTLDNRRLEAFRRAGTAVPYRMATDDEVRREQGKFTTTNDGTSVIVRGP